MQSLITSYLLQSGACSLPGIGSLQLKRIPAAVDSSNKEILPHSEEIVFSDTTTSETDGLVKYISKRKGIELAEAEKELKEFCTDCKERLEAGEKVELPPIGVFKKNSNGNIEFIPEKSYSFYQPVAVKDVFQNAEVPEIENTAEEQDLVAESNYEEQVVVEKSNWGLWAIILIAIASVVIFYNIRMNKLSGTSTGNQTKVVADSAKATYKIIR